MARLYGFTMYVYYEAAENKKKAIIVLFKKLYLNEFHILLSDFATFTAVSEPMD